MTRHNQGARKKKITYKASLHGVERAEAAFKRYGFESKSNFAKSQFISRSTVTKFFQRQPIQLDSFKRICDALRLDWKEIAELEEAAKLVEEKQLEPLKTVVKSSSVINQEEEAGMSRRQVTVIDRETKTVKAVITLEGDINSVSNLKILELILREHSGSTIKINDIQEGSIKLTIEGSQEDIKKLQKLIESGELDELDGFPVESIQILGESSDESENNQVIDKWNLASQIVSKQIENGDLSNVDLSDTYLIGADLSDVDLSGADLSGAELSDTNLINLLEALDAVWEIKDEYFRADVLISLADKQPKLFTEALQTATEIKDEYYRANALISLADKLPELLLLSRSKITYLFLALSSALSALSAVFYRKSSTGKGVTEALAAAREIKNENYRAKVLISLADKLPEELLTEAVAAAREIQYEYYRVKVLISLADKLPELLPEALAAAREIKDNEYRANVLISLADKLPPELLTEALATAREIKNENYRANVLQAIVNKLLPYDASLNKISHSFANLERATLINTDLSKVDLRRGNLRKANFKKANLEHAFLNNADLSQAKLIETNLIYANLRDANLVNGTLIGAKLANANLIGANLIDADLSGANVENAKFGHNQGISDEMRRNLQQRGAIFVDEPPREDSRVLVPV